MFNVLPNNLKKILTQEYHVRVAILACVLLLVVEGCVCIFLLPSLLVGSIKKDQIAHEVALAQQVPPSHTSTVSDTITSVNQLLQVINTSLVYPSPKSFLDTILSSRVAGIQLDEYTYTYTDATHATISLQGVSATRAALVAFVTALQNSNTFASVDLPVSDLAHDTHIVFTLNMTGQSTHTQ